MDRQKIKEAGLKLTPQRLAILDYLRDNLEHPSAEDIYKAMLERFPTMSLATVYNTLETLREKGAIQEVTIDPQKKRFDPNPRPHHHLICTRCKRVLDIHIDYQLHVPEAKKNGFEIVGNHIEFYGICPDCRLKMSVMQS
ncbi:MAG: Fur family transcriptional regulator [Thermodesulfovibrionales bacterium]|nr:Fur family transcriptional regulator [Thermodesulfovibrionales bacterium]